MEFQKHGYGSLDTGYARGRNGSFDPRSAYIFVANPHSSPDVPRTVRFDIDSNRGGKTSPITLCLPMDEMKAFALELLQKCGATSNTVCDLEVGGE